MTREKLYDVAVIGGGLAGLCLAIQCADNGLSVILFEKEEYPFHKVCGEYISLESWNFLQSLGLQLREMNLPLIKTLNLSDASGQSYKFDLDLGGFGISRYALDNALYKIALNRGVEVSTKTKVNQVIFTPNVFNIHSAKGTVQSKLAAGCFGKRSNLDIKWNRAFVKQKSDALNNYIGIKYHIKYPHDASEISLHNFYNGYCGMSKIEGDKSCLCYLTTAENLRAANSSIRELERQFLYKNRWIKEIFEQAEFIYDEPLAISQISFSKKSQVEDHVLMLGDAAGMITPLCGNGMSMAMHASKIAFTNVNAYLQNQISRREMEAKYKSEWAKQFSGRLFIGRTVQYLFGGNTTTSVFIKGMSRLPSLSKRIIAATHGQSF